MGVTDHDDVSGPGWLTGMHDDFVTGDQAGPHGVPLDSVARASPKQPTDQVASARDRDRRKRSQLAVYQVTSRFLVAQKISWISLTASISSWACTAESSTFTDEQSFAAFQNTSWMLGLASR